MLPDVCDIRNCDIFEFNTLPILLHVCIWFRYLCVNCLNYVTPNLQKIKNKIKIKFQNVLNFLFLEWNICGTCINFTRCVISGIAWLLHMVLFFIERAISWTKVSILIWQATNNYEKAVQLNWNSPQVSLHWLFCEEFIFKCSFTFPCSVIILVLVWCAVKIFFRLSITGDLLYRYSYFL